jgi:hypothetical protein
VKLKNRPTVGHSPGEVACPNVGLSIDSHENHEQQGILRVNWGEGMKCHCEGKEIEMEGAHSNKKVMDDVELWPNFFRFRNKLAGNLT